MAREQPNVEVAAVGGIPGAVKAEGEGVGVNFCHWSGDARDDDGAAAGRVAQRRADGQGRPAREVFRVTVYRIEKSPREVKGHAVGVRLEAERHLLLAFGLRQ